MANEVDCVVTLGNQTKTWSQYKFGRFSDWAGHFDAANGNGQVEIYENVGGKRGALLAKATRFLPPGPVLIAIKGDWPPVSDTPTALGSIEAIANRYEENGLWFHFLILKMIILPRQARDKHGESSKRYYAFPSLPQRRQLHGRFHRLRPLHVANQDCAACAILSSPCVVPSLSW